MLADLQNMAAQTEQYVRVTDQHVNQSFTAGYLKPSFNTLVPIHQQEEFTVYWSEFDKQFTFSLHLDHDPLGHSMSKEKEAKLYINNNHPQKDMSYAEITNRVLDKVKEKLPSLDLKTKKDLLEKALKNIQSYKDHYEKYLQANKKIKQGVASAEQEIIREEKILSKLENNQSTRPNPLLVLLLTRPELLERDEEEEFFI